MGVFLIVFLYNLSLTLLNSEYFLNPSTQKGHAPTTVGSFTMRPARAVADAGVQKIPLVPSSLVKPTIGIPHKERIPAVNAAPGTGVLGQLAPCNTVLSPTESAGCSVSIDETVSTCDSMKSPDIEYLDSVDSSSLTALESRASENLCISERSNSAGLAFCMS